MIPLALALVLNPADPVTGRWRGGVRVERANLAAPTARERRLVAEVERHVYGLLVRSDGTFSSFRDGGKPVTGTWRAFEKGYLFRYRDPVNPKGFAEQRWLLRGDDLVFRPPASSGGIAVVVLHRRS